MEENLEKKKFSLDPIFHTVSMVRVLRAQGLADYARTLLEQLRLKSPSDPRLEEFTARQEAQKTDSLPS